MARIPVLTTLLKDCWSNAYSSATVFSDLSRQNLEDVGSRWRNQVAERRARAHALPGFENWEDQGWYWNWVEKYDRRADRIRFPSYALEVEGYLEGLLYLIVGPDYVCRIATQRDAQLVYVDLVATAPWNRDHPDGTSPHYEGVGVSLVTQAIFHSQTCGFGGRVGLHSIPDAQGFYRRCGMTELEADRQYGHMVYFESTPEQSQLFLDKWAFRRTP